MQNLTSNVRRLAIIPARRFVGGGGGNNGANGGGNNGNGGGGGLLGANGAADAGGGPLGPNEGIDPNATLMPTPRSLHVLWQEYAVGVGGRKAARLFTPQERGRVRHKYTRRKVVWQTVDRMVRGQGLTAQVAIDRIYTHYGADLTTTEIINRMLHDRRANTIPGVLM